LAIRTINPIIIMKRLIQNPGTAGNSSTTRSLLASAIFLCMSAFAHAQCPPPTITPSGSTDLCAGQSVTLTATTGVSYVWSTGATTQAIVVSTAGNFIVTVDDGAGCVEASDPTQVTKFGNIPQRPSTVTGPSGVCPGETVRYSIRTALRAVSYTWTLPTGVTSGGLSSVTTTDTILDVDIDVSFVTGSTMSVIATNGCGNSAVRNKALNRRNPPRPTAITGPDFTCPSGVYDFSVPAVAGVDSWNWTVPAGASLSGQGNDTVQITFPVAYINGTVSASAVNGCGTSNPRNLQTFAYAANPDTIFGPTSGLCGTTQTYTINPVAGAISYTWTPPTGSSVVSGQGTTSVQILFSGGLNNNAYVKVASVNICGSRGNRRLPVQGDVAIATQPTDLSVCQNSTSTFTVVVPGSNISYLWYKDGVSLSNGPNISGADSSTLTIAVTDVTDAGNYHVLVDNGCSATISSDTVALTVVEPFTAPPGPISGVDVACTGTLGLAFSIAPVPGADSYIWTPYNGSSIASGQGTNSVTVDFGPSINSGYIIDVRAVNACGVSDSTKKFIRNTVSVPLYSVFPAVACPGQTGVVYEVDTVSGALTYNWTVSGGTIASGQGTTAITVDFDPAFTTGEVCVSATNQCMTTVDRCEPVISLPDMPGQIQGLGNNVCNSTQSYTVNPVVGASSYTWTVGTGATINSGQGTNSISVTFDPSYVTDTISVTAINTCGSSDPKKRQVNAFPAKIPSILGNAGPCANSSGNAYSVAPITGATSYSWGVFTGATLASGQGTTNVTVDFGPTDGIITVAPVNACGAGYTTNLRIIFTCRIAGTTQMINVALYPNPANEKLFVQNQDKPAADRIVISDLSGKTVYAIDRPTSGSDGVYELDINSLTPGMYLIEMYTAGEKAVSRFVKE
jgi:hypothetical protein